MQDNKCVALLIDSCFMFSICFATIFKGFHSKKLRQSNFDLHQLCTCWPIYFHGNKQNIVIVQLNHVLFLRQDFFLVLLILFLLAFTFGLSATITITTCITHHCFIIFIHRHVNYVSILPYLHSLQDNEKHKLRFNFPKTTQCYFLQDVGPMQIQHCNT